MAATTPARCETTCILCDAPVKIGDEIFPAAEATKEDGHGPGKLRWAHGVCFGLLPNPERWRPPLCRCWLRRGRCPMLEAGCCAFGHPEDHRGAEEGQGARRWGGRRRLVRNGHRAAALRVFLQATLSLEGLRSGTVLDVAGGKGTLSWELINCVGASHCVVVDPRPLDTRYLVKKWRSGHYEPHRTGPVYCKWFPAVGNGDGSTREPLDPPHCRVFFNASDILCLLDGKVDPETWFAAETSRARNVQWTTKGLGHEEETDDLEGYTSSICGCGDDDNEEEGVERCASDPERSQDADFRETEIQNGKEALELFRSASLVVGMHPDQAAGEAAQFAIARRLPWAVVPCCVYSRQFPKRRLRDGTPVTKYAHLVTWLRELHPRTRTAELPFEGRNTCIYMLPEDYS